MNKNLSDAEAKKVLLKWPNRTRNLWLPPGGRGFWIRGQPKDGKAPTPIISSPGAQIFKTQPDGLWIHFNSSSSCDLVVVEVCGSIQNLNDKRSRYIPASHSIVLKCSAKWLKEEVVVQKHGKKTRWVAAGSLYNSEPKDDLEVPVRYMRILYAISNNLYDKWCAEYVPTGYEFFCPHSSLGTYNSQAMQKFLRQMSITAHFRVRIKTKDKAP